MVFTKTKLNVIDNSGASKVKCIKVLGGSKKTSVLEGDVLVVSVYSLKKKNREFSKVSKGNVLKALVLRKKKKTKKKDGSFFNFYDNSVCLLNNKKKLIGTRIVGPLSRTIKKTSLIKMYNISTGFL